MIHPALSFCIALALFIAVAVVCLPLWGLGLACAWLGQKAIWLGHSIHFNLQKLALKLAGSLE